MAVDCALRTASSHGVPCYFWGANGVGVDIGSSDGVDGGGATTSSGRNPYLGLLAWADHLLVTADSINMVSEASAVGKPLYVVQPSKTHRRFRHFHEHMLAIKRTRVWNGVLEQPGLWCFGEAVDQVAPHVSADTYHAAELIVKMLAARGERIL